MVDILPVLSRLDHCASTFRQMLLGIRKSSTLNILNFFSNPSDK